VYVESVRISVRKKRNCTGAWKLEPSEGRVNQVTTKPEGRGKENAAVLLQKRKKKGRVQGWGPSKQIRGFALFSFKQKAKRRNVPDGGKRKHSRQKRVLGTEKWRVFWWERV